MNFKQITLTAAALVFASASYATPLYTGSTTSATALLPNTSQNSNTSGYYIWNDEASMADWHIRWTSDLNSTGTTSWFGNLTFRDSNLGTTAAVTFENTDDVLQVSYDDFMMGGMDVLGFTSVTNNTGGIDGIDFTIENNLELMVFSLGTSLYTADSSNTPTESSLIYIGGDLRTPDVFIANNNFGTLQSFEIAVPEPSILALFGLGLAGLGFAARKKAQA